MCATATDRNTLVSDSGPLVQDRDDCLRHAPRYTTVIHCDQDYRVILVCTNHQGFSPDSLLDSLRRCAAVAVTAEPVLDNWV